MSGTTNHFRNQMQYKKGQINNLKKFLIDYYYWLFCEKNNFIIALKTCHWMCVYVCSKILLGLGLSAKRMALGKHCGWCIVLTTKCLKVRYPKTSLAGHQNYNRTLTGCFKSLQRALDIWHLPLKKLLQHLQKES